jgi:hypothetical protein
MKVIIKLPKGFRRLKQGESLKDGDYQLICEDVGYARLSWFWFQGLDTGVKSRPGNFNIRRK